MYIDIDQRIREVVPMGFEVHETGSNKQYIFGPFCTLGNLFYGGNIDDLVRKVGMERDLWNNSLGTLGGGNHFIELGRSEKTGKYYLTIHSGSRNFGKRVCDYHAKNLDGYKKMLGEEVELIKQTLPQQQWNDAIKQAKKRLQGREGYLTGKAKEEYLKDMYTAQAYASVNRYTMLHLILGRMGWQCGKTIETVHNYVIKTI
jgi:RNA-splicing ligase RtcB